MRTEVHHLHACGKAWCLGSWYWRDSRCCMSQSSSSQVQLREGEIQQWQGCNAIALT